MLWHGVDDFVSRTVQFVRDGLDLGEQVMVAVPGDRLRRVRHALGNDADAVVLADMESVGANPARIIAAWAEFLHASGGRPSRGMGEPLWAGRRDAEVQECQLHESLLNAAVPTDTPFWLRCPYEADALPTSFIEESIRTHPWMADDHGRRRPTPHFVHEAAQLAVCRNPARTARCTHRPDDHPQHPAFGPRPGAHRGPGLRHRRGTRRRPGARPARAGRQLGRARRRWRHAAAVAHADALVCEVTDVGIVADPLTGRFAPDTEEPDGRGLWMVNQLCDLVQLRSSAAGTTVRVHTWL